jgi:hypothetical protein
MMKKLVLATDGNDFCVIEDDARWQLYGRKIFMMLRLEAWSQCFMNADRILLVQTVENFVNTAVFGTEESHSQWRAPINKKNEIEQISFTAWQARKKKSMVDYSCPTKVSKYMVLPWVLYKISL